MDGTVPHAPALPCSVVLRIREVRQNAKPVETFLCRSQQFGATIVNGARVG